MTGCMYGTLSGTKPPEDLTKVTAARLNELLKDVDKSDWPGQLLRKNIQAEIDRRKIEKIVQQLNVNKFVRDHITRWVSNYSDEFIQIMLKEYT